MALRPGVGQRGDGREAGYLEGRGLRVMRTDGARAFVAVMRVDGHEARLLDVRTDDLGGPYDAVLAHAMLLHLTCPDCPRLPLPVPQDLRGVHRVRAL